MKKYSSPPLPRRMLAEVHARCAAAQASPRFHRDGSGFRGCPRCAEVPGAGVCPLPGTLEQVMLLFNKTAVLCASKNCKRHESSARYWPPAVQDRLEIFQAATVDRELENRRDGSEIAELLGLRGKFAKTKAAREYVHGPWHRVRALLASLEVVLSAERRGLDSILVVEGDVRPVPKNQLSSEEIAALQAWLSASDSRWQVLRLGGYFRSHSQYRSTSERSVGCPASCRCNGVPASLTAAAASTFRILDATDGGSGEDRLIGPLITTHPGRALNLYTGRSPSRSYSRFCEIDPPVVASDEAWPAAPFCNVKDTVAFAVHKRAFPAFRRLRNRALSALRVALRRSRSAAAGSAGPSDASLVPLNYTLGLSDAHYETSLPWFDVWMPARLTNVYVLPVLVVQQVRQGDEATSVKFAKDCKPEALDVMRAVPRPPKREPRRTTRNSAQNTRRHGTGRKVHVGG